VTETGVVTFGGTNIAYQVRRSARRRKTLQITLDPEVGVVVSVPKRTPAKAIHEFVAHRAEWIVRRASEQVLRPKSRRFANGETLPYLGKQVPVSVQPGAGARVTVKLQTGMFCIVAPLRLAAEERRAAIERALITWYRRRAAEELTDRVDGWSRIAGYRANAVLVRDQRRRWGSCGQDGTLRFNWRLIMAAPALIDYVVVHELAHLQVRNHSKEFWAEVARLMPEYQIHRRALREVGPGLGL
jgi:predicted metal-dependent hydrolase